MWASGNSQPRSTAGADGAELLTGSPRGMEAFWPHQTQQNSQQNCFNKGVQNCLENWMWCLAPVISARGCLEFKEVNSRTAGVKERRVLWGRESRGGRESREANCMKVAAL